MSGHYWIETKGKDDFINNILIDDVGVEQIYHRKVQFEIN